MPQSHIQFLAVAQALQIRGSDTIYQAEYITAQQAARQHGEGRTSSYQRNQQHSPPALSKLNIKLVISKISILSSHLYCVKI